MPGRGATRAKAFHDDGLRRRCLQQSDALSLPPSLVTREADITHRPANRGGRRSIGQSHRAYAHPRPFPFPAICICPNNLSAAATAPPPFRPEARMWTNDLPLSIKRKRGRSPLRHSGSRHIVKALTKTQKHAASPLCLFATHVRGRS